MGEEAQRMATTYKRGSLYWGRVQRKGRDLREPLKTTSKSVAKRRLAEWIERLEAVGWGDKPRRLYDDAMRTFLMEHGVSGEKYNMRKLTAAHRTLPFDTKVRVTNLRNGRTVKVRINDRGPFVGGRIIDLSRKAAKKLKMIEDGVAPVGLEILD